MAVKYLILVGVVIATIGAGWLFWQRHLDVLDQLAEAEAKIEAHEEAARIHREYLVKLRQQATQWDELANELLTLDGKDAPLPDYLRAAAGRMWP